MKPYLYNAILGFLSLVVLILPFTGKVHNNSRKWLSGFTVRGGIVCAAFISTIFVNYLKDIQTDKDDLAKAVAAKVEKRKDDHYRQRR